VDVISNPVLWLAVLLLTVSGVAFSYVKYVFGKQGWAVVHKKYPNFDEERIDRLTNWYIVHGSVILLLSAIPGIDTLVTITAGAVGIRPIAFVVWVMLAKFARFSLLAVLFTGIITPFQG